jgi:hypothetical protein
MGLDYSYALVVAEELGTCAGGSIPMAIGVQTDMATPALARWGADELRREFLAPAIAGDAVAAIAVSEVGGGSDVAALKTTAKKDGDDYVINGSKMWITNAAQADWLCVLANTGDGPVHLNKSLIIVPTKAKGVTDRRQARQARHARVGHLPGVLRGRAGAAAPPHRRRGHGLHDADGAVPGGAAVRRGQLAQGHGEGGRRDDRLLQGPPDLRQPAHRQPGDPLPPGRAARPRSNSCARWSTARSRTTSAAPT